MSRAPCRTAAQVAISMSMGTPELILGVPPVTHTSNLLQITHGVYPQHLYCNLLAKILALPYIRKPTTGVWDVHWVVAYFDMQ